MAKMLGLGIVFGWAICVSAQTTQSPDQTPSHLKDCGLVYRVKVCNEPRPLRIHCLRVDLDNPRIEPAALIGPDPDGSGPAEATLQPPETLVRRAGGSIAALVNANAFSGLPDAKGRRNSNWHVDMPVDIGGLAASSGTYRSDPAGAYESVWFDRSNRPHIGTPEKSSDVREGLAGFQSLLKKGKVVGRPDGPLHPRTALGIEPDGRHLHLVVVDGRQKGYSEGMTLEELAKTMLELGCQDAVNLDGGGSSILMLANERGSPTVTNRPSGRVNGKIAVRPIPTALAIRKKQP